MAGRSGDAHRVFTRPFREKFKVRPDQGGGLCFVVVASQEEGFRPEKSMSERASQKLESNHMGEEHSTVMVGQLSVSPR